MKELGSEVARQPDGEVVQQSRKDFSHYMTESEYFDTNRIGGSLSISLETLDH